MKLRNCKYNEIESRFRGKNIIIFGVGEYFKYFIAEHFPYNLRDQVIFFIDNNCDIQSINIWNRQILVKEVDSICNEKDCIIVIASSNYMYDMYKQLVEICLPDTVECYSFGLIMAVSCGNENDDIVKAFYNTYNKARIPRKIHTFWFSGEDKPEEYRKCIESWHKFCPNYEIVEWNCENYNCSKNHFMEEAIKCRKWAFAADVARLDVVWKYGGLYLDADMELLSSLDDYLGNKAFFSFNSENDIDLFMFASEPHNPLLKELMEIYTNLHFSINKRSELCQPRLIRNIFKKHGVRLDGNMQMFEDNIFLTRNYLSSLDNCIYQMLDKEYRLLGIHHCNAGWREDGFRKARIENNRKLMKEIISN